MTALYDTSVLFPADMLVDYANHLLKEAGSSSTVTGVKSMGERHVVFSAKGSHGAKMEIVAPMGLPRTGMAFFRSLLKVRPTAANVSWLINGQSSTGTSEIAFYGENGPWLTTTVDNVRAYLETARPTSGDYDKARFEAYVEERIKHAVSDSHLTDEAEIHSWTDGHKREPLRKPEHTPAP